MTKGTVMTKMSVDKILVKANFCAKKGEITKSQNLYQIVLQAFPKNKRALNGLALLKKQQQSFPSKNPSQLVLNQLLNLYSEGQFLNVVKQGTALTLQYPESFMLWNILGAGHKGLGQIEMALQAFIMVTKLKPNYVDGINNMGVAFQEQGKLDDAIEAYSKALSIKPEYAEAHNNMGNALKEQGKLDDAIEAYKNALLTKPDYAEAHNNMGVAFQEQGKLDDAIEAYSKALLIKPDYVNAYFNLGNIFSEQGKLDDAIEAYKNALLTKPDYAEVYNNMGITLQEQGKLGDAIEVYSKALSIKPDYAEVHNNMGNVLKDQGKLDDAIEAYSKALLIKPDYANACLNMGNVLKEQGKLDDAIEVYKNALLKKPDYAEVLNNMGVIFQEQGSLGNAIKVFNKALSIKSDYAEAHRNLSTIIRYKLNDPQINTLIKLLKRNDIKGDARCHLHYAYAKMNDDLGNLNAAFENYVAGGKLRKKLLSYDLEQDKLIFDQIKSTAPILKNILIKEPIKPCYITPIFILGMPRSGTTLVEQIISSHSEVQGAGELGFLHSFGDPIGRGNEAINSDNILKFRKTYLHELQKVSNGKCLVTDKMPSNFLYLGLIMKALPEAKVIHVKRDPAATCWSNFKHYFNANGLGYSWNLNDVVNYFGMYRDLMNIWNNLYGDKIYHLDYDRLTLEPECETRKLIKRCDLNWEEACLSPQENKRSVSTASQQQVRERIYTGSSAAWRKFESHLNGAFDKL